MLVTMPLPNSFSSVSIGRTCGKVSLTTFPNVEFASKPRHQYLQVWITAKPPKIADGHTLGLDLVGLLPEFDGHRYLLVMYDAFSHFLRTEVIDIKLNFATLDAFIPADGNASTAVQNEISCRMCTYHPQSNFTERVDRFIGAVLRSCVESTTRPVTDWVKFARYVAFVCNRIYIPRTQISPCATAVNHGCRTTCI